ncbi:MAG: hypothetical protein R3B06_03755 [Kofleriaceae bacterium]
MPTSPGLKRLRALLRAPEQRALKAHLRDTAWWYDDDDDADLTGVAFVSGAAVGARGVVGDQAGIVVVDGEVRARHLLVAGSGASGTVIFLGPLRVASLALAPETNAACAAVLDASELMFVASPDASFTTLAEAQIAVLYSGHGDGWLTARGPVAIDVLDDHVEGTRPKVARRHVTASDLVAPALRDPRLAGQLDREAVLAAIVNEASLLAAPAAQAKPAQAKPALAKRTPAKPALAKPALAKPTQAKPTQAKPALAKPTSAKRNPAKARRA